MADHLAFQRVDQKCGVVLHDGVLSPDRTMAIAEPLARTDHDGLLAVFVRRGTSEEVAIFFRWMFVGGTARARRLEDRIPRRLAKRLRVVMIHVDRVAMLERPELARAVAPQP